MREYKFRGKNKDIGWVYGQLAYDINGNTYIIQEVEIDASYGLEESILFATMWYKVDKNTVGQFTGLFDKNKKEIYDGDIVKKETYDDEYPNHRKPSYAKVGYVESCSGYYLLNKRNKIYWDLASDRYNIEVIGNIYENKDLLEKM